jgi:hypothetical protein
MEEKSVLQKIQQGAKGFTESVEEGITPFIPPEIRKLKPSMDFVMSGMPPNVIRSAGAKTQQFFDSDMKDISSGIGALGETASMLAPVGLLARFGAKAGMMPQMSRKAVEDFFQLPVSSFKPPTDDGKGFITLHGSRHDFDQFDLGKIGTGEKNQVFGYGLYFTDVPGIANWYRNAGGHPRGKKGPIYETLVKSTKEDFLDHNIKIKDQPEIFKRMKALPYFDDFKTFFAERRDINNKYLSTPRFPVLEEAEGKIVLDELANFQIVKDKTPKERSELMTIIGALRFVDKNNRRADEVAATDLWNVGIDGIKYKPGQLTQTRSKKDGFTAALPGLSGDKRVKAVAEDKNYVVFDDTILNVLNKYGADGKALRLERKDKGGYAIPETVVPPVEVSKKDIDTLFEAMDEEGALLEFPELGKKLNRYTFKNDRNALIEAITDEDYPAYEAAMKGMLKRTFPSGKIPVRRVENYTELQLFGTKDPETLAMMEQAGLQKLKDQKKVVTEKLIDIDDVKFVGNPAEEELIILDTPRQFRKGAMIGDKQLLSYTINLPKKVEKKAKGGIAGLSDVARDMFKGPKGIGAYQPFMVG